MLCVIIADLVMVPLALLLALNFAFAGPRPGVANTLNRAAGNEVIYELQVRTANADARIYGCQSLLRNRHRPEGIGTFEALLEDSTDYRLGITLRYLKEKLGVTTIWLMPIFPNNDRWSLPSDMDRLGSPYAVRDYFHASGLLSRLCIEKGRDEFTWEETGGDPCWGNFAFDQVLAKARSLGLKVMLDLALNHFGHNYLFYDYVTFQGMPEQPDVLWDYERTFDPMLLHPEILDSIEKLGHSGDSALLDSLLARCPGLSGNDLVRAFNQWRLMQDWERRQFSCEEPLYPEFLVPGFFLNREASGPSRSVTDLFSSEWRDVKFLNHHEQSAGDSYRVFARNREYLFRIMNYWVSRGVEGFRLDHATDPHSGMGPNEWKYILGKVNYYDWVRHGRPENFSPRITYLAEEFHDQEGMNLVVDVLTEGYVGDMNGRHASNKDASFVEAQLEKDSRFSGRAFVMRALETHDEKRLTEETGFDAWTGAVFWAIGAASRGTPMLLMGQEFGESWQLSFRGPDFLRSRFPGEANYREEGEALRDLYQAIIRARLDDRNRALRGPNRVFLRLPNGEKDERIFAQARWLSDNVVLTFFNLWETGSLELFYALPPLMESGRRYRWVNIFSEMEYLGCHAAEELQQGIPVRLNAHERLLWLRLELCD